MKEKIIAVIFCITIVAISGSTLIKRVVTSEQSNTEVSVSQDTNKNSIAENHEIEKEWMKQMEEEDAAEEAELDGDSNAEITQTKEPEEEESEEEEEQSFLDVIKSSIDDFAGNLNGKEEGAEISARISGASSGDSYIESKVVLLGKDNWLFYKAEDDGNTIADYKGTNHYTKSRMKKMADKLKKDQEFLKSKGCEMILLMVPCKENVYSEYMPDTIKRESTTSKQDIFAKYLQKNTDIPVVYPKEALMTAKSLCQTYYKTDTHWTQRGAFIATQMLKEQIDGNYQSISDVEFDVVDKSYAGDLAKLCKMTDRFNDDVKEKLKSKTVDRSIRSKKKVLLIGDSFSELLEPLCNEYFRNFHRQEIWGYHASMLDSIQPDIVVWECAERYTDRLNYFTMDR